MRILYDSVPETSLTVQVYPFDNDMTRFVEVALLVYYVGTQKHWPPPQVKHYSMASRRTDEAEAIRQATGQAALIAGHLSLRIPSMPLRRCRAMVPARRLLASP